MKPDILQTLRAEHDVIRLLCGQLLETSGSKGTRDQLWLRLKSELVCHARAEEIALYDVLAGITSTRTLAAHSVEEHLAIDELVDQLDHLGFDQPQWLATLERLVHVSNHHLDEEEVELFPVVGRVLDTATKERATDVYRDAKLQVEQAEQARVQNTTETGRDQRSYESRPLDDLRDLALDRNIERAGTLARSELISALRGINATDA